MKPLFGDMAQKTLNNQKEKLDLNEKELTHDDYVIISESIRDLCMHMAGSGIADRIYQGLMEIIEKEGA